MANQEAGSNEMHRGSVAADQFPIFSPITKEVVKRFGQWAEAGRRIPAEQDPRATAIPEAESRLGERPQQARATGPRIPHHDYGGGGTDGKPGSTIPTLVPIPDPARRVRGRRPG